jgi:hypothetical protein
MTVQVFPINNGNEEGLSLRGAQRRSNLAPQSRAIEYLARGVAPTTIPGA